jgi:uncharacterized membrane protein
MKLRFSKWTILEMPIILILGLIWFMVIISTLVFGCMLFTVAFKEFVLTNPQSTNIIGTWINSLIPTFAFLSFILLLAVLVYKTIYYPSKVAGGLINRIRKNNVTNK